MGQVWGIGKRRVGKDWGKRVWLFDRLVWSVISYGVEIWGWKSRDRVEGLQDRFLRWGLGVQWRTPGYLVRQELQREMLKGRTGMRAWEYERKLEEGQGGQVARIEAGEERRVLGGWEEERNGFYEERGWAVVEVQRRRDGGELGGGQELVSVERRIRESRFNRWYRAVKGVEVPGYLKEGWGEQMEKGS